eukprot:11131484-Ditylum_brightwellii.AAC.1
MAVKSNTDATIAKNTSMCHPHASPSHFHTYYNLFQDSCKIHDLEMSLGIAHSEEKKLSLSSSEC